MQPGFRCCQSGEDNRGIDTTGTKRRKVAQCLDRHSIRCIASWSCLCHEATAINRGCHDADVHAFLTEGTASNGLGEVLGEAHS